MSDFVHLHSHSHYSLLQALPKIDEMIDHVKDQGMEAVALTDNGVLYGAIEFYKTAKDKDVKPIFGMDAIVARHGREKKRARIDTKPFRLVLLAENKQGYLNLVKLSSLGFIEGFYYRPRIDKELLREYNEGLIALSGGHYGEVNELLRNDDDEKAREAVKEYIEIFGRDNFFLELVDRPEIAEQETVNAKLLEIADEVDLEVVATKDTYYLESEDIEAWKVLNCVKKGQTLDHFERVRQHDYDASMVSGTYMKERFSDAPEAIENTRKIADRCNVELDLGEWHFPKYEIPDDKTFREVLTEEALAGAKEKIGEITDEVEERIEYEIDIIDDKGFCPYFLIVADFIQWARDREIVTTTRGSAAGSLVGYSIGISTINPLKYKLPFERFLNPGRPSAPDIDADFADNRRDEVLQYVGEKYGEDKVAQICTFGTMLARGSIRDVGRALGYSYDFVDEVAKLVPLGSQGFTVTLENALEETKELKERYDNDPQVKRIINVAQQIEGCARHVSIHAAGTVVAPTELTDFTPLQIDTREGKVITQYEMHSVEETGLVKMDFLGLRNLSILGDAIQIVKKTKGDEVELEDIPLDDEKAFDLLAEGRTMGVFQLSSDGMTKYLMQLEPTRIEDIMAMVALYRPGPIEFIPEYIDRKHNPEKIDYPHPSLEEILDKSLGLLIYQDDIMLTAIKLAGYSWLEADKFRKAMGKKIPELMDEQEKKFKKGCIENGIDEKTTNDLWARIKPFAAYGFNKSHAASYGMVAYQTAYMKANYPAEYMSALMTAESSDLDKIADAVEECERMEINVLPPDINESLSNFTYMDDNNIRFGLLAIKGLGEEVIKAMIQERKENGEYVDLADFAGRVKHRAFNKKSLEALIKSGALDRFGERRQLLENIDRVLNFNKHSQKEQEQNQASMFDLAPDVMERRITLRETDSADQKTLLSWEKELLGLYVSAHPFERVQESIGDHLVPCKKIEDVREDEFVRSGGAIGAVKKITTKKGNPMAFVTLEDVSGRLEIVVFPNAYKDYEALLVEGRMVLVSGKVSKRDEEEAKILANNFIPVDGNLKRIEKMLGNGMWLPDQFSHSDVHTADMQKDREDEVPSFKTRKDSVQKNDAKEEEGDASSGLAISLKGKPSQDLIKKLRDVFQLNPGEQRVHFLVESGGKMRRIQTEYEIEVNDEVVDELAAMVGRQNIDELSE
jgi:DNA polymerase-3 subunit alpha